MALDGVIHSIEIIYLDVGVVMRGLTEKSKSPRRLILCELDVRGGFNYLCALGDTLLADIMSTGMAHVDVGFNATRLLVVIISNSHGCLMGGCQDGKGFRSFKVRYT